MKEPKSKSGAMVCSDLHRRNLAFIGIAVLALSFFLLAVPMMSVQITTPERCVGGSCIRPMTYTYTTSVSAFLFGYGAYTSSYGYYFFGPFG
jgi:hypothetical protein